MLAFVCGDGKYTGRFVPLPALVRLPALGVASSLRTGPESPGQGTVHVGKGETQGPGPRGSEERKGRDGEHTSGHFTAGCGGKA